MDAVRLMGAAVVVLSFATVGIALKASHDTDETSNRLCEYIQENARVTKVRSTATLKRDAAEDAFLSGSARLGSKGPTPSPFTKLSQVYLQATKEVAVERERNPLPDPPEKCN